MQWLKNLFGGNDNPPAAKPPQPAHEARPALTPQAWLHQLFERHGLACTLHEDWVVPHGEFPAVRGTWHAGDTHGRLDVQVLVREGLLIEESFGGIGAGDTGLADGLQNFTINSFHPLLSALWHQHDPEQVEAETWTTAGRRYNAFIGNIGRRTNTAETPSPPTDLLARLETAVRHEPLDGDLHWFRFCVAHINGEFTWEALKDNEPWPAGVSALQACSWHTGEGFYSARLFIVLREAADEPQLPA